MKSVSRSNIIRKGSLSLILRGVIMLVKVILLVVIVRRVGQDSFGVYTLLLAAQQFNVFEAGLGAFITREISSRSQTPRDGELDTLLSTGALTMLGIGIFSTLVMWAFLFTAFDPLILTKPEHIEQFIGKIDPAKHLAALAFLLIFGNMFCQRILTGLHAFEVARIISVSTSLLLLGGVLLLVPHGLAPAESVNRLVAVWAAVEFLTFTASWIAWKTLMPCKARIRLSQFRRNVANQSAGFAWPLVTSKIMSIVLDKLDVWIVGAFLGPASVAVLEIAKRVMNMTIQLVSELAITVFPFASRLLSTEPERIRAFMRDGTYYVFSFSAAFCTLAAALAPPAILIFLGEDYRASIPLLWILLGAIILNNIASCGTQVWLSMGLYKYVLIPTALGAVVGLGLQFILVREIDEMGAAVGVAVGMALRTAGVLVWQQRTIPGGLVPPFAALWRPALFLVTAYVVAVANPWSARASTITEFAVLMVVWSAAIGLGLAVFVLQKQDRNLIASKLAAMARSVGIIKA